MEIAVNKITNVTRKRILDAIAKLEWHGELNEADFLDKIFDLHKLESTDPRFEDMYGDVFQHRVNNRDYSDNWFISEPRLNLLEIDDNTFTKFILQTLNPLIVSNPSCINTLLGIYNEYLINDGFEIVIDNYISGEPTYKINIVSNTDILHNLLSRLMAGCTAIATNGSFSDTEFMTLKQSLRKDNGLYQLLPQFVLKSHQAINIRRRMQDQSEHYAERRDYINEQFHPAFQYLDSKDNTTTDQAIETLLPNAEWECIGMGGFGVVYRANHKYIDHPFAIKVFNPSPFSIGVHDYDRFFKEAKILFSLNHPNIIKIYDVGMLDDRPFIKMEFFPGENLNKILCRCGRLTPNKAMELVSAVGNGLKYAFETSGIVHRDLKPSNIMATKPSLIKVIDFGLSVYIEDDLTSRLTKTGEQVASGVYSSPWLLENPKLIDPICDIYSLGAIWYECLTGRVPQGIGIEEKLNAANDVPEEHKKMIIKCLQTDREKAFDSWADFCRSLEVIAKQKLNLE